MKQKTEQIIIVYDNIRNKQAIETQSILVIFFNKNIYVALCYDLYVFYLVIKKYYKKSRLDYYYYRLKITLCTIEVHILVSLSAQQNFFYFFLFYLGTFKVLVLPTTKKSSLKNTKKIELEYIQYIAVFIHTLYTIYKCL